MVLERVPQVVEPLQHHDIGRLLILAHAQHRLIDRIVVVLAYLSDIAD